MTDLAVDEMQPYARAFMLAHPGERFVGWRYIIWISAQWREWADEIDAPYGVRPMTADDHAAFGAWLADRWEAS